MDRNWFTLAGAKYIGRDKNKQVAATHPLPTTHCTPIHVSFSQRLGGDLPGVHGLHYGFLLSLELERVLPMRLNEGKIIQVTEGVPTAKDGSKVQEQRA